MKIYGFDSKKLMTFGNAFDISIQQNKMQSVDIVIPGFKWFFPKKRRRYVDAIGKMLEQYKEDLPFLDCGDMYGLACGAVGIPVDYGFPRKIETYGGGSWTVDDTRNIIKERFEWQKMGYGFDRFMRTFYPEKLDNFTDEEIADGQSFYNHFRDNMPKDRMAGFAYLFEKFYPERTKAKERGGLTHYQILNLVSFYIKLRNIIQTDKWRQEWKEKNPGKKYDCGESHEKMSEEHRDAIKRKKITEARLSAQRRLWLKRTGRPAELGHTGRDARTRKVRQSISELKEFMEQFKKETDKLIAEKQKN